MQGNIASRLESHSIISRNSHMVFTISKPQSGGKFDSESRPECMKHIMGG